LTTTSADGEQEPPRRMQQPEDVTPEQMAADAWADLERVKLKLAQLELPEQVHPSEAVQRIAVAMQGVMATTLAALTATVQGDQAERLRRLGNQLQQMIEWRRRHDARVENVVSPEEAAAFERDVRQAAGVGDPGPLEVLGDAQEHYVNALRWLDNTGEPQDGEMWPSGDWARASWHLMRAQALEGVDRAVSAELRDRVNADVNAMREPIAADIELYRDGPWSKGHGFDAATATTVLNVAAAIARGQIVWDESGNPSAFDRSLLEPRSKPGSPCPTHGPHPHDGMVCLDCPECHR